MEAALKAIAAPRRRQILSLVRDGELSAGEYAREVSLGREKIAATGAPHWQAYLSAWDANDAEAVRVLYAQLRQRFGDWREEFERLHEQNERGTFGLPEEFAQRYAELDRRLTQLLADVKQLDARANEVRGAIDDPLDKIAEGALKL